MSAPKAKAKAKAQPKAAPAPVVVLPAALAALVDSIQTDGLTADQLRLLRQRLSAKVTEVRAAEDEQRLTELVPSPLQTFIRGGGVRLAYEEWACVGCGSDVHAGLRVAFSIQRDPADAAVPCRLVLTLGGCRDGGADELKVGQQSVWSSRDMEVDPGSIEAAVHVGNFRAASGITPADCPDNGVRNGVRVMVERFVEVLSGRMSRKGFGDPATAPYGFDPPFEYSGARA
uniref:Uncharacterized protein n=1 Tax=Chromera velia CCMP2878 TaxID=1169474 RepID=A0A0G4I242_9ALVE|eukprot:Cvel_10315.t1-p1 / transcript=Cvel_10315.t1 / gene=Cvel_10315 / organism=Chromera_velia_CCMP2878 / gene_product=hypothetical protein / transcript_product=hypothetical protein / location=Cvel_scaffold619:38987-39673(-) / protein_length=229 / sequence_SO=supercontig / SO=protein_coding / is_pseudo=false